MKYPAIYYGEYLKLDQILNAQHLKSAQYGEAAHDETLFIIIHQTYELWFKQIIHEMSSVHSFLNQARVRPSSLSTIVHRLERIVEIQRVLVDQLKIIETMTSLDFMDFRDYLVPASGFQSTQFRSIEIMMGLKSQYRLEADKQFFKTRLNPEDQKKMLQLEEQPSILELIDQWLARMPFMQKEHFDFWQEYESSIHRILDNEQKIIESNTTLTSDQKRFELMNHQATKASFETLFDPKRYNELLKNGEVRLGLQAKKAAIFIRLFSDKPILQLPNRILDLLVDIDEMFTLWRYKHVLMANRILGAKIGTGGSSGHEYLKKSADNNKVFVDLFDLATFLLPKSEIPQLPSELIKDLGFMFEVD